VTWIPRYEIVRAGGIGTLDEDVIVRVAGDAQRADGSHDVGMIPDQIEKLALESACGSLTPGAKGLPYIPIRQVAKHTTWRAA